MNQIIIAAISSALIFSSTMLRAQVPQLVNYQGRVVVGTTNFNGTGQFRFALVDAGGTIYWTNSPDTSPQDGIPDAATTLTVTSGLYSVLLGDTTLGNMTAIPTSVFNNPDVRLRVWFNDGVNGIQQFTPDQRLATSGYIPDGAVTDSKLASHLSLNAVYINLQPGASAGTGCIDMNNSRLLTYSTNSNLIFGQGAGYLFGPPDAGTNNTAIGPGAFGHFGGGQNNIALGSGAGGNLDSGSNNIYVGSAGPAGFGVSESNIIRIGTSGTQTKTFISGIRGVTTGTNNAQTVVIDSNGQLGTISSSRRYKEDVVDMGELSSRLRHLRPVTFRYMTPYDNGEKPIQFGLIAEEVAEVFPELTVFDAEGRPDSVKYQDLTPIMLNEVQKLTAENEELKNQLAQRDARDKERDLRISRLESLLPSARGQHASKPKEN